MKVRKKREQGVKLNALLLLQKKMHGFVKKKEFGPYSSMLFVALYSHLENVKKRTNGFRVIS